MKQGSLDKIIVEVMQRFESSDMDEQDACAFADDIYAYMPPDPVLARLHKDYVEASKRHRQLVRFRGPRDPMAEVAADMLDSIRSAVQTRLIELQDMREEETRAELERTIRARQAEQEAAFARQLIEKRQKDRASDLYFWAMMMYWLMNCTFVAAHKKLSAANEFAMASGTRQKRVSYA